MVDATGAGASEVATTVDHRAILTPGSDSARIRTLADVISVYGASEQGGTTRTIVFTATKREADELCVSAPLSPPRRLLPLSISLLGYNSKTRANTQKSSHSRSILFPASAIGDHTQYGPRAVPRRAPNSHTPRHFGKDGRPEKEGLRHF